MKDVVQVKTKAQLKSFIDFPRGLYRLEPNYIGELNLTLRRKLSKKNPFLEHSQTALFMARNSKNGKILGRIAAIYNTQHLDIQKDNTGFFGYFDSVDDDEVCELLFDQTYRWLKARNIQRLIGPTNFTTNNSCGILTDGFKFPNQVEMPYNFPYYKDLLESQGFSKAIDLFAYHLKDKPCLEKYSNIMARAESRIIQHGIRIRSITAKSFKSDMDRLRKAYNKFNRNNWGFIPLGRKEFSHMAKDLKQIMPYQLAIIMEKNQRLIGYIVAVPDFNQVLKRIPNGKLWPSGVFKIYKYSKRIDSARVMLIGIDDEYRGTGLDLILYKRITMALHKENIYQCEPSYVMETNLPMNSLLSKIGGTKKKRFRLFQKPI